MVPFDLRPPAVLRWPYDGCSWLQGANLQEAELQGTSLEGAKLQGANLSLAQLQASSLKSAWLDAASLFGSELQGAILNGARLHGASLNGAQLQGAVVSDVELDGASFGFTFILQGLNECARGCRGARIPKSSVWRMRGTPYSIKLTTFDMIDATTQPFPAKSFAKWRDGILNSLPDIKYREQARQRLSTLDPESQTPRDVVSERNWKQIESIRADESDFEGKILSFLSGLACASENAPFVAKGLIRNERFGAAGLMLPQLIQKLRDTRQCPGAAELTVDDFDQLTRIAEHRQHELAGGKDAGVPDPQLPNRK
jgi:uncharacterized protein YjbI with pentapeptide repeats